LLLLNHQPLTTGCVVAQWVLAGVIWQEWRHG
jgi:hypothetical protein